MTSGSVRAACHPPRVHGKFLDAENGRFLVKGVAYGTFAPNGDGDQFPSLAAGQSGLHADGGRRNQHGPHLHGAAA